MKENSTLKNVTGRILVVDDEMINRELIIDILEEKGHLVKPAENGEVALKLVEKFDPDLILLDVMMPDISGFDVCEKLKSNVKTQHIPIIFITALDSNDDISRGLALGATDFLTKPINSKDVIIRSRNAIFLKQLLDKEKNYVKEVIDLQKLNDEIIHMIIHDMRNPLSGMVGYIDLLNSDFKYSENDLHKKIIKIIMEQTDRLALMVSSLLDINKFEKGKMKLNLSETDVILLIQKVTTLFQANGKNIKIMLESEFTEVIIKIDENIIERVLENLVSNSIKFSPNDSEIKITIQKEKEKFKIKVIDQGPGIPEDYLEKVFDKFSQVESKTNSYKHSTGLGLTFCKLAIEKHNGTIGVYNNTDTGSTFWFTI